ncbi:NAD(P)-dependent dehydrogenase (short-subunit alcohol dehydrogenase family) [Pseudomonas nitritireducens]|uniref:NAD(P)-dependent dehydrogenase (Short-subunit alcohol dehydrogenase family) n=1 Tax=Pseudomonas nitroreducens TaxID=46680 RepID=A0A7W7P331_PSENT|nr:SDR family NAD(P)-dependent oxidoreductase [Pseudomonas nitritireducens]MBB4864892.1 NAD(P)-dependent dehydrogenase (short-subunit alcohol dehydrogenase family) [Pseudomonas nitritireducens]
MDQPLSQRVVAITGAFGNLGQVLAEMAASQGARLVLIDHASSERHSSADCLLLPDTDLTSSTACQAVAARIEEHFGRLDALVNVAGGFAWEPVQGGDVETWDRLYALNLRTALLTTQALLPLIRRSDAGRIVNLGAGAAAKAGLGMGAYAASKAGVMRLTESLAEELKDQGVTVNAVLPSIIDTPQNRAAMPEAPFDRWVTPQQLAAVILFLLSDAACAISGAAIPVSGRV